LPKHLLGKPALSVAAARLNRMDSDDEQLLRGRIYGTDLDHPGPKPGRSYAELVGGPLDGLLFDITGWRPEEIDDGASLAMELGQFGAGAGRCTTLAPATRPAGTGAATARDHLPGLHGWKWTPRW
jgi:hypothetical protein